MNLPKEQIMIIEENVLRNIGIDEKIFPEDFAKRLNVSSHWNFFNEKNQLIIELGLMVCENAIFEEWKAVSIPDRNNLNIDIPTQTMIINTKKNKFFSYHKTSSN